MPNDLTRVFYQSVWTLNFRRKDGVKISTWIWKIQVIQCLVNLKETLIALQMGLNLFHVQILLYFLASLISINYLFNAYFDWLAVIFWRNYRSFPFLILQRSIIKHFLSVILVITGITIDKASFWPSICVTLQFSAINSAPLLYVLLYQDATFFPASRKMEIL